MLVYFIVVGIFSTTCQGTSYDNPACVVNPDLPASDNGNYMDCSVPVMVEMGKTECCTIETEVGCCQPNGNWKKMEIIAICLAVTTAVLAAACVYFFWCRKNPKVAKVEAFFQRRYHRVQESCSCLACCRRQVAERKKIEEMQRKARQVPALELPAESNADDTTFDNFWRGPMVKS